MEYMVYLLWFMEYGLSILLLFWNSLSEQFRALPFHIKTGELGCPGTVWRKNVQDGYESGDFLTFGEHCGAQKENTFRP